MCLITNDKNEILLAEGYDTVKKEFYFYPLGGGVEFNEFAVDAVRREFLEELNAEISEPEFLFTIESVFVLDGVPKHDIVFVYRADFADKKLYEQREFHYVESSGQAEKALWIKTEDCLNGKYKLVPEELCAKMGSEWKTTPQSPPPA